MPAEHYRSRLQGRTHPEQITTVLCFTCGEMFSNNVDYQHHLMLHQSVSLCCQLYYLDHQYKKTEAKKKESIESASNKRSPTPTADTINVRRSTAPAASLERRMSIEAATRERIFSLEDDQQKRKVGKYSENKKHRENSEEMEPPLKKNKIFTDFVLEETVIPLEIVKGHMELMPAKMTCTLCKSTPTFDFPILAIDHYVRQHEVMIEKTEFHFLEGESIVRSKNATTELYCTACEIQLDEIESHLHLLENHFEISVGHLLAGKDFTNIDSVICNVTMRIGETAETIPIRALIFTQ